MQANNNNNSLVPNPTAAAAVVPTNNDPQIALAQVDEEVRKTQEHLKKLQQEVRTAYLHLEEQRIIQKGLQAYEKNSPASVPDSIPPSAKRRKKGSAIPSEIKALIVKKVMYEGSMSWDNAIKTYEVSRASISRIINSEKNSKKEDEEPVKKAHKRGRESPITVEMLTYLLLELDKNSQLTLNDMVTMLETKYHIETSTSAVDRALKKCEVTWKNVLSMLVDWNTNDVITARTMFVGSLGGIFMRNIIYVDESGFNLHIKKSKGRALSGEPAKLTLVPKGKRVTLIGALSKQGMIHYRLVESVGEKRGTNAEDFRSFLLDLFSKIEKNSVIILDNCRIHHSEKLDTLWNMANQTYGIDKLFLPPYSPFLNPIEYAFNHLKELVQAEKFKNRGELIAVIKEKIPLLTPEKSVGFYNQSAKYYPQCALGLPFRGKPLQPEIPDNNNASPQPLLGWN